LRFRFVLRRGLQYMLLSRGVRVLQAVVMIVFGYWAAQALLRGRPWTLLLVIGVATMVEATMKELLAQLMPVIDRRFFREAYDARRILLDVGEDAARLAAQPRELLQAFSTRIERALHPSSIELLPAGAAPPGRLLVPVASPAHPHAVIALGDKLSDEPWTKEDRELLAGAAAQVAAALENARLFARLAERQRLERELEIAREVQQQLFPRDLPAHAGLRCAGACHPALEVGGDYYDVLPLGPSRVALALGDVSGKGIAAALLMARLQALVRSHAALHVEDPPAVIAAVNRMMLDGSNGARYATLFYGVYDGEDLTLRYVNAGHNPPLLLRAGGDLETLGIGGPVVGLLPGADYEAGRIRLEPGDTLVMFSDGITEADDASGDMFGDERLLGLLGGARGAGPVEIRDALLAAVERHVAGGEVRDDRTVLVARREG
jgi:serine phosphatase RsbU (regulator of sigma subunit)